MNKRFLLLFFLVILLAQAVSASQLISFQGRVGQNGQSVALGNLTVYLWDTSTGGNQVWNDTFTDSIVNGYFDVVLGSSNQMFLVYGRRYWLDMDVNTQDIDWEGSERVEIEAGVGTISNVSINTTQIQLRVVGTCGVGSYIRVINENGTVQCEAVSGGASLSTGWNRSGGNVYLYDTSESVGIGTTSPGAKLDVNGTISTNITSCSEALETDSSGNIVCGVDDDTTYTAAGDSYIILSVLDFILNETKLNNTIDARENDTTYTENSIYLTLTGTIFGLDEAVLNQTIDARENDTTYSAAGDNYITLTGTDFTLNEATLNTTIDIRATANDNDTTYTENDKYLTLTGTIFGLDEAVLNQTIDARENDTTYTENDKYLTLTGTIFGLDETVLNTTIDDKITASDGGWSSDGTTTNTSLNVDIGNGGLFVNTTSGLVGIGTTGPDTALHIVGGFCVDNDAACADPGAGSAYIQGSLTVAGGNITFGATPISEADISIVDDGTITLGTETTGTYDSNPSDDLTTATNFLGDVTGNYNTMAVGDDSHNHTSGTLPAATTYLGASIDDTEMTAEDFGDWTCTGLEDGCTIDSTTSANWISKVSDETGTGTWVFNNAPAFTGETSITGTSTSWGTVPTAGWKTTMGTGASATWLAYGESSNTFRGGLQLLDSGGSMRIYVGSGYISISSAGDLTVSGGDITFGTTAISEANIGIVDDGTITLGTETTGTYDSNPSDDLTTTTNFLGDVTGNYNTMAVGDDSHNHTAGTLPAATTYLGTDIALTTETTGNYVLTVSGGTAITVTGADGEGATKTVAVTNDAIGDTQLAFNTGQHLNITSNVDFNQLDVTDFITASGGVHVGGISDPGTDNLIVDGEAKVIGMTNTSGGLVIETRTSDPASPATGRMWLIVS